MGEQVEERLAHAVGRRAQMGGASAGSAWGCERVALEATADDAHQAGCRAMERLRCAPSPWHCRAAAPAAREPHPHPPPPPGAAMPLGCRAGRGWAEGLAEHGIEGGDGLVDIGL